MNTRAAETVLARLTIVGLFIFVPLETFASWPDGLWHPMYLVDVVSMILMAWGALRSLRARPNPSPAVLCVAYAWASCSGWRATSWRVFAVIDGEPLRHGISEFWIVTAATAIGLVFFITLLQLTVRAEQRSPAEIHP